MLNTMLNTITAILQDFCDNEGFDIDVYNDSEFYAYPYDREVYYSLLVNKEQSAWVMENAFNMGLNYDCGNFILSFLHEIGHCETEELLTKGQKISRTKRKKSLDGLCKEDNFIYFGLPDEKMATEWAINYANENKGKLQRLAVKIQREMNKMME